MRALDEPRQFCSLLWCGCRHLLRPRNWFDREELSRIVEFIRCGGLAASRAKEKADIFEERLRQDQMSADRRRSSVYEPGDADDHNRLSGIASARALLKLLIG